VPKRCENDLGVAIACVSLVVAFCCGVGLAFSLVSRLQ
jgi:hypothetical protein